MNYPLVSLANPLIAPGRYIVPMGDTLRPFVNQMSINGYRLCKTDLIEIIQQILEWLDAYALSGYAIRPTGFVVDTNRLILNVKPVITSEGHMVLYDVTYEEHFINDCTELAREFFRQFARLYLVMPGSRSNFYLERLLPNYSLVMMAVSELVFDNVYQTPPTKGKYGT